MATGNHVIFIHPDGTSPTQFAAVRFIDQGPDGQLNWDKLSNAGVYLGHMQDQITGTSNGGAVTHATGVKVYAESFGLGRLTNANGQPVDVDGNLITTSGPGTRFADAPLTALSGQQNQTIMQEAVAAGKATALINSGVIAEPGTGAFASQVGYADVPETATGFEAFPRGQFAQITEQVVRSEIDVILGGGLINYLPVGTTPPPEAAALNITAAQLDAISTSSAQRPNVNLIDLAKSLGYTVVYTKEQLDAVVADPSVTKVLGIFAVEDTFNDNVRRFSSTDGTATNVSGTEEGLGLNTTAPEPFYVPTAPTVGQMLAAANQIMERNPKFQQGSLTVLEEEGTDNFGNINNAPGQIEAVRRADQAIGVAIEIANQNPNTLVLTAADSEAGGVQIREGVTVPAAPDVPTVRVNPTLETDPTDLNPVDGSTGSTNSAEQPWTAFTSEPAENGMTSDFGMSWVGTPDFAGSIVAKAHGLNADQLPATVDNTDIDRLMYQTLFEVELPSPVPASQPEPAPELSPNPDRPQTGNVIFIHPDGASIAYYGATRFVDQGPDGRLNWDKMTNTGVYLGHLSDQLTGSSDGSAVTHAMGIKAYGDSFGQDADGNAYTSLSGQVGTTIMEEARDAGKAIAIINSGYIAEPGSGAFLAEVGDRSEAAAITKQIVEAGADPEARVVVLGGGLINYLPIGTQPPAGASSYTTTAAQLDAISVDPLDRPTENLIELAKSVGFTVVYNLEQLKALPANTQKVLGIFALENTYNDQTEEDLSLNTSSPTPLYAPGAPTAAEMLTEALRIVSTDPDGFMVVLEEEGSDNFGNDNNASGALEATRRADAALGVAMEYIRNESPETMLLTTADSEAGGLQAWQPTPFGAGLPPGQNTVPTVGVNPTSTTTPERVAPVISSNRLDGTTGSTASATQPWIPFQSEAGAGGPATPFPNASGAMGNFGIGWAGTSDAPGNMVVKSYGQGSDLLSANRSFESEPGTSVDNTDIYRLMYTTLFVPNGTNQADWLLGTQQFDNADQIFGFGGSDSIDGLGGSDRLFGGEGNDTVQGATGNDFLAGESGDDHLHGGDGNDRLEGNAGIDVLRGNFGNDTLHGGQDKDYLEGGSGKDLLVGDLGNDFLVGSRGNDSLQGGSGRDTLLGDNGDDMLVGGADNDRLTGGTGNDRFYFKTSQAFDASSFGIDRIIDFNRSGDHTDQIVLSRTTFTAGTLFASVESDLLAATSEAAIAFSTDTGRLFYNQNGSSSGLGSGGQFAILSSINGDSISQTNTLLSTDFLIVT
ncbi:MAG: alkaline phosphatase [Aphanocapsa sp. GSE-SYN-MK-11-07L]|jgi:glycerophosphoryl diester phosphodiesterase|nr:alkaline phosphatase [Aphanocapsa sp. GSE-SYN-MK-11-07L]